jgi:hypothetical protein
MSSTLMFPTNANRISFATGWYHGTFVGKCRHWVEIKNPAR